MMTNRDFNEANIFLQYHCCLKRYDTNTCNTVANADRDAIRGRSAEIGNVVGIALRYH